MAAKDYTCSFSVESTTDTGHGGTATDTTLTLASSTSATATLVAGEHEAPCILHLERQGGARPAMVVEAVGTSCTSYFSTGPSVTMTGTYPFRSAINYIGPNGDECFLDDSPARLVTCTHRDVAALEAQWHDLDEAYSLQPLASKDESGYTRSQRIDKAIQRACDPDPDPGRCLTRRYTADIATMGAKKDADIKGTVDRGDPADGGRLAKRIAGRYRKTFLNGDVQGDHFNTTDTMTLAPLGAASIHFEVELNFFNGHTCSLAGGALYRKDGSFVFDDSPAHNFMPDTPACRLAIIPSATGIRFRDITGGCKNYCGERGSLDGAGFSFRNRVTHKEESDR